MPNPEGKCNRKTRPERVRHGIFFWFCVDSFCAANLRELKPFLILFARVAGPHSLSLGAVPSSRRSRRLDVRVPADG